MRKMSLSRLIAFGGGAALLLSIILSPLKVDAANGDGGWGRGTDDIVYVSRPLQASCKEEAIALVKANPMTYVLEDFGGNALSGVFEIPVGTAVSDAWYKNLMASEGIMNVDGSGGRLAIEVVDEEVYTCQHYMNWYAEYAWGEPIHGYKLAFPGDVSGTDGHYISGLYCYDGYDHYVWGWNERYAKYGCSVPNTIVGAPQVNCRVGPSYEGGVTWAESHPESKTYAACNEIVSRGLKSGNPLAVMEHRYFIQPIKNWFDSSGSPEYWESANNTGYAIDQQWRAPQDYNANLTREKRMILRGELVSGLCKCGCIRRGSGVATVDLTIGHYNSSHTSRGINRGDGVVIDLYKTIATTNESRAFNYAEKQNIFDPSISKYWEHYGVTDPGNGGYGLHVVGGTTGFGTYCESHPYYHVHTNTGAGGVYFGGSAFDGDSPSADLSAPGWSHKQTMYVVQMRKVNNYTIKFDPNKPSSASGNVSGSVADMSVQAGSSCNLPSYGYTMTGWRQVGWGTSASSGVDPKYAAGAGYTPSSSVTFYAVWEPITYNVIVDPNKPSDATNNVEYKQ